MSEFDWLPYTRTPILDVPAAVALGHALLSASPGSAPDAVKSAAQAMRGDIGALQRAWASTLPEKSPDPRPLDTRYDGAWTALRDRLSATASLPEQEHREDVLRAHQLVAVLFPTGGDFLKLPFPKQWAECEKRIAMVEAQGLRKDIDRLAGAPFWTQIEALHKSYGEMLGITKGKEPAPAATKLIEPLRTAQRAIANYLLQVAAAAAREEAFVPQALRALAPVDAAREAAARRAKGAPSEPVVTPDTPLPEGAAD